MVICFKISLQGNCSGRYPFIVVGALESIHKRIPESSFYFLCKVYLTICEVMIIKDAFKTCVKYDIFKLLEFLVIFQFFYRFCFAYLIVSLDSLPVALRQQIFCHGWRLREISLQQNEQKAFGAYSSISSFFSSVTAFRPFFTTQSLSWGSRTLFQRVNVKCSVMIIMYYALDNVKFQNIERLSKLSKLSSPKFVKGVSFLS